MHLLLTVEEAGLKEMKKFQYSKELPVRSYYCNTDTHIFIIQTHL